MSAVVQSAIGNAILVRLDAIASQAASSNGNKSAPAMTPAQFHTITEAIKGLPTKQDVRGGDTKPDPELRRLMEDVNSTLKTNHSRAKYLALFAAVVAAAFGLGYLMCGSIYRPTQMFGLNKPRLMPTLGLNIPCCPASICPCVAPAPISPWIVDG